MSAKECGGVVAVIVARGRRGTAFYYTFSQWAGLQEDDRAGICGLLEHVCDGRNVDGYRAFLERETAALVTGVQSLRSALARGDLGAARRAYAVARVPYERVEPVAKSSAISTPASTRAPTTSRSPGGRAFTRSSAGCGWRRRPREPRSWPTAS